jgi:hypothetical protein
MGRNGKMKIVQTALFLIAILVPAQSRAQETDLPADVADLISRRTSCDDWTARGKDDPTLTGDLSNIRATLRCTEMPQVEAAVRERYQGNSAVLTALNAKWTKFVKRLPVRIEIPPDQHD